MEGDKEGGLNNLNLINTRYFILDLTLELKHNYGRIKENAYIMSIVFQSEFIWLVKIENQESH